MGTNELTALVGLAIGGVCATAAIVKRWRMVALFIAAAFVGGALGAAHGFIVQEHARAFEDARGPFAVELLEDSANSGFGERALVRISSATGESAVASMMWKGDGAVLAGERFEVTGSFTASDFENDAFSWADGSSGSFKASSIDKRRSPALMQELIGFRESAIRAIGDEDDAHRLLQALVCGYRREMRQTELYGSFQTCGLAHLVAVSGAHLVIVTGLIASALKMVHTPRRIAAVLLVTSMALYFVLAGMPVSALRAAIMSGLGLFAYFGKRRASSLNAVGVGVFAIVGSNPAASLSASFALSALSTVGIIVFSPLVTALLHQVPFGRFPFVVEALSLTLSAALLSQLYACSLFNLLPLASPLANVVCAPLFPFACGLGLAGACAAVLFPAEGFLATAPAALFAWMLETAVKFLAHAPYASIPFTIETPLALGVSAACAMLLWALWPQRIQTVASLTCACLVVIAVGFVLTNDPSDKIVMLDVGQGDAFLVQSKGKSLLVDTGNQDTRLLGQLAQCRVVHLDAVLVTHADDDHCGSLDALRGAVVVDRVIVSQGMFECDGDAAASLVREAQLTAPDVIGMNQGDAFDMGSFNIRAVWPMEFTEEGGNADSLCVVLAYDGDNDGATDVVTLMTGDAENEELAHMIEMGLIGQVDVLKVGHHGSRNGATPQEMRTLSPKIALVSCGKNNRYGHPAEEALQMLHDVGATVFRTDIDGRVKCVFSADGVHVT